MQFKSKKEIKVWKQQLKFRPLVKSDKEEAQNLFYRSHQSNIVHQALENNEQEFKRQQSKVFENDYIYERSFVLVDPSNNGKILMVYIIKDMADLVIKPPNKDEITCPKEFLKLQLYYDTWKPLENEKFVRGEYETSSGCTDIDYQGLGLAIKIYEKYYPEAYLRGVKHTYDIFYNHITFKLGNKYKSFNSQILNQVNLKHYQLNGINIFDKFENDGGLLVKKDITDEVMMEAGFHFTVQKKKYKLYQQKQNISPKL